MLSFTFELLNEISFQLIVAEANTIQLRIFVNYSHKSFMFYGWTPGAKVRKLLRKKLLRNLRVL
jgi:hypothetical protein